MRQTFELDMDDGTHVVVESDARDIRAWEAEYESSYFTAGITFTTIAQVAYIAAKRTGALNGQYPDYAAFDAHCVEARGKRVKPDADPTRPDRTDGLSVNSRSGSERSRRNSKPKTTR
jgi:hypothetical protein